MSLEKRSYEKELLDADNIPFADILQNMRELNTVNTLLGGHAITCEGVRHFINNKNTAIHIAEIGCGGGDNLNAIHALLLRNEIAHQLTGIDIKQECIDTAKQHYPNMPATWIPSDYSSIQWNSNDMPDVIFSSLFCHHFTDEELVEQLKWMQINSRKGFFINDLQRHPLAYYSIKILTRLFSTSYLVKNDAPLSVKRGFIKREWKQLLEQAGIYHYTIRYRWAFRYLICVDNEPG